MCTSEKKDYGLLRPGFDPKDAGFFWEEDVPDAAGVQKPSEQGDQTDGCGHVDRNHR